MSVKIPQIVSLLLKKKKRYVRLYPEALKSKIRKLESAYLKESWSASKIITDGQEKHQEIPKKIWITMAAAFL